MHAKTPPLLLRSVLFCPANEERKVRRLAQSGADAVILDLEDAVAAKEKVKARGLARAALPDIHGVLRAVRVNAFDTGLTVEDVKGVVCADLDLVVLPKAETAEDVRRIDRLIGEAEAAQGLPPGAIGLVAIVETCVGIHNGYEIARASPRLVRLAFGSGDLGNDLALPTIRGDMKAALAYGRGKLVYDARAAGLPSPLDGPHLAVRDLEALEEDSRVARDLGHGGRICIHPAQVPVVNAVFSPQAEEVALARKVVDAFNAAEEEGSASITVEGTFVDYPIVYKAQRILAVAAAIAAKQERPA